MAAQPEDTISPPRLRTTSAILGGTACRVVGTKTFPLNRRLESSPNGTARGQESCRQVQSEEPCFRTNLNSIRGLIRVTGQPVLTFSVADVAADTLRTMDSMTCRATVQRVLRPNRRGEGPQRYWLVWSALLYLANHPATLGWRYATKCLDNPCLLQSSRRNAL